MTTGGPPDPDDADFADGSEDRDFDEPVPDKSEQLDVEDPAYSLMDDDLSADPLDQGIDAPDGWSAAENYGTTDEEEREGESLDQQLSAEVPDPVLEEINGDAPRRRRSREGDQPAERAAVTVVDEDTDRAAVMHDGTPEETLQEAEQAVEEDMAAEAGETRADER
ncbi:hypothetical protein EDD29_0272 [Actinocorallia herbida]|uniref:DUF5709 domain-containing protein n=1 Tax=Actinocorallia herbida TaxID=58109 RepID=A0A3N1CPZ0_9ACTN|nr:hypothetical protein [Actinocorallia herbida]ROO82788.1 hypothetical protein EDD29_0272 [Actinocorallia herbida]